MKRVLSLTAGLALALSLAACGSPSSSSPTDLPSAAEEGRELAKNNGCAGCHGSNFGGGVGPTWQGLSGSTVSLANGETVLAERSYLIESIKNPNAKRVAGFTSAMPAVSLTDDEISKIVDFIESLK